MTTGALLIIPTLNEVDNIAQAITGALASGCDVLVVDDGSTDGTLDVVDDLAATHPNRIFSLRRTTKQGLAAAYRDGFRWGLHAGYRAFGEMDADLSHNPAVIPALLHGLTAFDLVIGSRYVPGGRTINWPLKRRLLSRMGGLYVRLLTGLPVADPTAGFRFYRREVIEYIDLDRIEANGYAFQIEMAIRTWLAGFHILEVPITFKDRTAGESKMSQHIVVEALIKVARWAPRSLFGLRRQRGRHLRLRRAHPWLH
ncbi:polyprenol monophosphomannose synthase [Stomatohabitans albus]|uniref:polyprenol monophosphomannose synthase n=1 Tax=Stomatohabitans albus TaxID=3110766 RepID=UPI00300D7254